MKDTNRNAAACEVTPEMISKIKADVMEEIIEAMARNDEVPEKETPGEESPEDLSKRLLSDLIRQGLSSDRDKAAAGKILRRIEKAAAFRRIRKGNFEIDELMVLKMIANGTATDLLDALNYAFDLGFKKGYDRSAMNRRAASKRLITGK